MSPQPINQATRFPLTADDLIRRAWLVRAIAMWQDDYGLGKQLGPWVKWCAWRDIVQDYRHAGTGLLRARLRDLYPRPS